MGNSSSTFMSENLSTAEEEKDFTLPDSIFGNIELPTSSTLKNVSDLPEELLVLIFSNLSVPELCLKVIPVCKLWNRIGHDSTLWTSLKFGSGWAATQNFTANTIKKLIKMSPFLKTFEYHSNNHISRIIHSLANYCPKLQTLELQSKALTFRALESLVINCPAICQLSMFKIDGIDHTKYLPLANLKNLRALEISFCEWADDQFILAMSTNCTKLEYLNLQSLCHITDRSLSVLLSSCKNSLKTLMLCIWNLSDKSFLKVAECLLLERLIIVPAIQISDAAFIKFQNLKNLHSITLSRLWNVSPPSSRAVFSHANLSNILEVDLVLADSVDDFVIKSLAENALSLKVLSLEGCVRVTDIGLCAVMSLSKKLVYLNLEAMHSLQGSFLCGIDYMLPLLRVLRVDHCTGIKKTLLKAVTCKIQGGKLGIFTEYSNIYTDVESVLLKYPPTHQARFHVNFDLLSINKKHLFDLSTYVCRKPIW